MKTLTIDNFIDAARELDCEVAMIMAFAETEAPSGGFDAKGRLTILFEPHIFWQQLQKVGINPQKLLKDHPEYAKFLYRTQGLRPYPGSSDGVYNQLLAAEKIHKEAAFRSTSWGKFQCMGFNAEEIGYKDVFEMWDDFKNGEDVHLKGFIKFIVKKNIQVPLRNLDYKRCALLYNGKKYYVNKYDEKIKANRLKYLKYNHLK